MDEKKNNLSNLKVSFSVLITQRNIQLETGKVSQTHFKISSTDSKNKNNLRFDLKMAFKTGLKKGSKEVKIQVVS